LNDAIRDDKRSMQLKRLYDSGSSAAAAAFLLVAVCAGLVFYPQSLRAQSAGPPETQNPEGAPKVQPAPPAKAAPKKTGGGTPWDTIRSTKLKADVPEARDFVRQSRPSSDSLDYQPTTGTDPQRPKLRTKAELDALKAELEGAIVTNKARTGQSKPTKPPPGAAADATKKAKSEKTTAD
jgi:hypothetical protein